MTAILVVLLCLAGAMGVRAQEPSPLPEGLGPLQHPWGHLDPGAWKQVRVITETLDEQGNVVSTSVTETKTTLLAVDDEDGVTLEVRVTVEVAGKRFAADPQIVAQGWNGEPSQQNLKVKPPTDSQVTIEGKAIPCKVQEIETRGPKTKTVSSVYYSDEVEPFVLHKETVVTPLEGGEKLAESTIDVVARDMPWKVLTELKSANLIRSVQKTQKGTTTTWSIASIDVPGGIISHTSKEVDSSGRLVRRSTLELVDYSARCEPGRVGLFGRRRRPPLRER